MEEIRHRYRELVKLHHPDRRGPCASSEKMAAVTDAYHSIVKGEAKETARDSRILNKFNAGATVQELMIDGEHEVIEVRLFLDGLLGENRGCQLAEADQADSGCLETVRVAKESSASAFEDHANFAKDLATIEVRAYATSLDSVADLKRDMEAAHGGQWGLSERRKDSERISIGWELVHNSEVLCHNFVLRDYGIRSGDRLYAVVRK